VSEENENHPESPSNADTIDMSAEAIAKAVQEACDDSEAAGQKLDLSTDSSIGDLPPSELSAELATEKDRVLRMQAEMENLRSRTAREINDERRYAPLPIARDLLPVLDNIDRAIEAATQQIEAAEQTAEAAGLLEGFKLVRQQLLTVLQQHHCQPIQAVGEPFDPQIHEAILQQPSDEQPANHVLQETQVGYQLHDRVVRASQVIISTGPGDTETA